MAFWLRVALAVFAISDRIAAWRLVDLLTKPVIQLLNVVPFFERQVMGDLTTGDIFAAALVTLGAFFALASLSIQRSPA